MQFIATTTEKGVTERLFDLTVAGERAPGVLWTPEGARGPRPLVLMGHGGTQHKKVENLMALAGQYARRLGYAVAALDAPGHGERVTPEEAERNRAEVEAVFRAGAAGQGAGFSPERLRAMAERGVKAAAEWKAALNALQTLDFVGDAGPVGYWGLSMGTAFGVPFVGSEPRITAALLGLAGLRAGQAAFEAAANNIKCPVLYIFQWEDEVAPRESGIALFNAFGATEKTMHINPGRHVEIPPHEAPTWEAFFRRHLGVAEGATA
jgi:dienelactone hydrolase